MSRRQRRQEPGRSLSHFRGRLDTEQREPGTENGYNPLHQGKARRSHFWIILDNEA